MSDANASSASTSSATHKTLLFVAFGTFATLAALTASLPLNLPRNQNADGGLAVNPIVMASNAYMMFCTICSLFMGPALAYFYGTLHGTTTELVKTTLLVMAVVTFLWVVFSFSLAWGEDANGDQIMGYPITYYMFRDVGGKPAKLCTGENCQLWTATTIFAIFELGFAIATPTLVAASLAGRVNTNAFLFFVFVWHLCIYCPISHIAWFPTGWLRDHIIEDFAGGIVVNMLASTTMLALHIVLGYNGRPKNVVTARPQTALQQGLFVSFLWFAWISGKQWNSGPVAGQAIVNTIGSVSAGLLTWYFYASYFDKPLTSVSLANSLVLSLVGIMPAAGFVTVGGAMCLTIFTHILTLFVATHFLGELTQPNESMSVLTIHGLGGSLGFFFTAIFSYAFINDQWSAFNGLTFGRGIPLAHHISLILVMWSACLIANLLCGYICNFLVPLASAEEAARAANASAVPKEDKDDKAPTSDIEMAPAPETA